ncbi:MAG: hypothetical protein GY822_24215 [Deltaproteobacteria bacterium]|nr:hypothetical protein [Deltaproteobacteria bacterium]
MHLAHHVKWSEHPTFSHEHYIQLFEDDELPWINEQTQSALMDDSCSQVIIRAR